MTGFSYRVVIRMIRKERQHFQILRKISVSIDAAKETEISQVSPGLRLALPAPGFPPQGAVPSMPTTSCVFVLAISSFSAFVPVHSNPPPAQQADWFSVQATFLNAYCEVISLQLIKIKGKNIF